MYDIDRALLYFFKEKMDLSFAQTILFMKFQCTFLFYPVYFGVIRKIVTRSYINRLNGVLHMILAHSNINYISGAKHGILVHTYMYILSLYIRFWCILYLYCDDVHKIIFIVNYIDVWLTS